MKLSDFRGLFKTKELEVESIENPYGDYYTIKLKILSDYTWIPGEHGIFKLKGKNVVGKKWRAFSVASISEEGFLLLGIRTGERVSSFKSELLSMKKGEKVSVRGPFGWFKVMDQTSPIVMIAGGVGITPIRAIVKSIENETSRPVHILHTSREFHLFADEFKTISEQNSLVQLDTLNSSSELKSSLDLLLKKYGNAAYYYISGSQSFIKSMTKQITDEKVKKNKIINDPFIGY